ncbi:YpjP family protein [Virgibacillus sp. C22-A2]|uniref:YpjP family protein n=1 Tax=Virgibacillus tibetensis TaxID=3042313 RepID=A0ABU6KFF4_9BACI|nr:YpjP family protein [Virgibacillus sp. C22-A2]
MKLWLRKIAVVFIAILTFGMYIPPAYINTDTEKNEEAISLKSASENVATQTLEVREEAEADITLGSDEGLFITTLTEKAREQMITKLGPRIVNQVEDDILSTILPSIEDVLQTILTEAEQDTLQYYSITENPSEGFGERIFNIYDYRTNKTVAKFHVRRDNRPLEGYWFNFHYHLSTDGFEEHHEIGEIYWDKNIPPKWMA